MQISLSERSKQLSPVPGTFLYFFFSHSFSPFFPFFFYFLFIIVLFFFVISLFLIFFLFSPSSSLLLSFSLFPPSPTFHHFSYPPRPLWFSLNCSVSISFLILNVFCFFFVFFGIFSFLRCLFFFSLLFFPSLSDSTFFSFFFVTCSEYFSYSFDVFLSFDFCLFVIFFVLFCFLMSPVYPNNSHAIITCGLLTPRVPNIKPGHYIIWKLMKIQYIPKVFFSVGHVN